MIIIGRLALEKALGVSVKQIAYPFGLHNRIVHLMAGLAGYAYAFTCQEGAVSPKHSMLAMPRLEIEGTHSMADFKGMVEAFAPTLKAEDVQEENLQSSQQKVELEVGEM